MCVGALSAVVGLSLYSLPSAGGAGLIDGARLNDNEAPAQPTAAGRLSQCNAAITATLSADTMQMCEAVDVQVGVDPFCPICPHGINVVFVQIDKAFQAPWMDDQSVQALDELMRSERRNEMQVGVVHYNSGMVTTRLRMTPNLMQARGPLMEPPYGHDPFGDVVGAATEALRLLRGEREGGRTGDPECEFIIFFASTKNIYPDMGAHMRDAANMIHRERVTLFVGCPETAVDYCDFTREMPKTMANYTEAPESGRLRNMVRNALREFGEEPTMRRLDFVNSIPLGLEVVPGSFNIAPSSVVTGAESVDYGWNWTQLRDTSPQTVTYRVQPNAIGAYGIEAWMTLVDETNLTRTSVMPAMPLTVTGECPSIVTPTPTNTSTPEPTPTSTSTPTPRPEPIYLPIVIGEKCTIQWVYSDVALVIDMSTSMDRPTREGGMFKDEAALAAAKLFVDMMDFSPNETGQNDRVAIVGFNRSAWIEQALTNDEAALLAAVDRLPARQEQFTRLDLAFEWGAMAIEPALRAEHSTPVIVMLTDGLPNQVPYAEDGTMETTVLRAAQAAKDSGAVVYTVGLGAPEDINAALLSQSATSPERYFYAPDAEDLSSVYSQIAYSFGCPRGRHKWGAPWP
jgi:Mg-chelatase subunit ChlD